ncbi:hypothetical protein Tco_0830507 [Tanacetum coccineum]
MLHLSTHQDSTTIMQAEQTVPNRKPKDKPERVGCCSRVRRLLKLFVLGLRVKLVSMVDDERRSRRFRESLRRVTDGAEAFLILTLFILCLDKVSTDHAKLVPLGKVCTAKETLEKNTAKALISLTDDLSLLSNMAALKSCPKHNMIAYLEKTEGNVEFHEVIDFLRRSYIYHAGMCLITHTFYL